MYLFTTCICCKFGHQVASHALPYFLGLSYWQYQLVLSGYLHQTESHQLSLRSLSEWVRLFPLYRHSHSKALSPQTLTTSDPNHHWEICEDCGIPASLFCQRTCAECKSWRKESIWFQGCWKVWYVGQWYWKCCCIMQQPLSESGESYPYQFKQNLYQILPRLSRMSEVTKLKRCFVKQFQERNFNITWSIGRQKWSWSMALERDGGYL